VKVSSIDDKPTKYVIKSLVILLPMVIIGIGVFSFTPIFAEMLGMFLTTEASEGSDTIFIHGQTASQVTDVTITVTSPDGFNRLAIDQVTPDENGNFETNLEIKETWNQNGFYAITAMQSVNDNSLYEISVKVEVINGQASETNVTESYLETGIYDASTNKSFYDYGDMVLVSGKIKNYDANVHSNVAVSYSVTDPKGESVTIGQTKPNSYGSFSFNFLAGGNLFELSGNYPIQLFFGSAKSEIPMFLNGGEPVPIDVTPPKILQPKDIEVEAETRDGFTKVSFEVLVIDDTDKIIQPSCMRGSGYLFGIGDTIVKCTAKDSAGNFATPVSFTITVNSPEASIPDWIKDVAAFWCDDRIDDGSFVDTIQYLIDYGIMAVPATSGSYTGSQEIPLWVKNNACWWSTGSITDEDFAYGIEYLVKQRIIQV
jgi:hypothetical protein